ncbi:uncharacterized protein [Dendropsophus ebraccatus]|uniref:uncharacterized protein n=1 Tax=Dendropsophus ebraccatus TaxID=150705 RepID=UPI003831257A
MSLNTYFDKIVNYHYSILAPSFLALLLLVLEDIMDLDFSCPSHSLLGIFYGLSYFLIPLLIFGILGYKFSGIPKCECTLNCVKKTLCAPLLWTCILLSDGRYIACIAESSFKIDQEKNVEYIISTDEEKIKKIAASVSFWRAIFQILGAVGIFVHVCLYTVCCNAEKSSCRCGYEEITGTAPAELVEVKNEIYEQQKETVNQTVNNTVKVIFSANNAVWIKKLEDIINEEKKKRKKNEEKKEKQNLESQKLAHHL